MSSSSAEAAAATADNDEEIHAEDKVCLICLDQVSDKPIKLPCDHVFCISCVEKWRSKYDSRSQRTCPHCRTPLPPTPEMATQLRTLQLLVAILQGRLTDQSIILIEDPVLLHIGDDLMRDIRSVEDPVLQQELLRTAIKAMLRSTQEEVERLQQIIGDAEVLLDQEDDAVDELPAEIGQAAARNDVETVLKWLGPPPVPAKRINAKWRGKMDRTLLHEAEFEGHLGLMQLLLQLGAKVDPRSAFGMTPFEQTVLNPELGDAARLLLKWGAVSDHPDRDDGELPHEAARKYAGNRELANLLQTPLGGRRCEIVGLENRADLNGKTAIATKYLKASERFAVQLEHTKEYVSVRPLNLRRRDRKPHDPGIYVKYEGRGPDDRQRFSEGLVFTSDEEARAFEEARKNMENA